MPSPLEKFWATFLIIVKSQSDHGQSIFQSEELAEAAVGLQPSFGPLGAAHQSALHASGIAEEGEYARELTKF